MQVAVIKSKEGTENACDIRISSRLTKEDLFPEGEDVVRSVLLPIGPNEALTMTKVTNPGETAGIAQRLRPGLRAFTIKVDVSTGVSGFLRPGHSVDIYWTGVVGGASRVRGNDATHLIGTAVEIIGVDQSADTNRSTNEMIILPVAEVEEQIVVAGPAPIEEACFINTRRGTETIQVPVQCTN